VGSGYDFYIVKSHSGYPVLHTGGDFIVMKLRIVQGREAPEVQSRFY